MTAGLLQATCARRPKPAPYWIRGRRLPGAATPSAGRYGPSASSATASTGCGVCCSEAGSGAGSGCCPNPGRNPNQPWRLLAMPLRKNPLHTLVRGLPGPKAYFSSACSSSVATPASGIPRPRWEDATLLSGRQPQPSHHRPIGPLAAPTPPPGAPTPPIVPPGSPPAPATTSSRLPAVRSYRRQHQCRRHLQGRPLHHPNRLRRGNPPTPAASAGTLAGSRSTSLVLQRRI